MSGLLVIAQFAGVNTYHHATTPEKTICQIVAPANHRLEIVEIAISFNGIAPTNIPIGVDWVVQSTAGTLGGDGAALTLVKGNPADDETILSSAQLARTDDAAWTAEPTTGNRQRAWKIHEQSRLMYLVPFSAPLIILGGQRGGLRVRNTNGAGVLCDGYIAFKE